MSGPQFPICQKIRWIRVEGGLEAYFSEYAVGRTVRGCVNEPSLTSMLNSGSFPFLAPPPPQITEDIKSTLVKPGYLTHLLGACGRILAGEGGGATGKLT